MDLKVGNRYRTGLILVFFTAIVSGFSIFVNSYGVKGFDSSVFTFSKNVVVGVLLFALVVGMGEFKVLKDLKWRQWRQLIFIGLIGGSIPFLLFFKGLQMTTGTTSAFIHKTLFIYVSIFALLFLKERLTKGLFVGGVLLLAGNFLLLSPDFVFGVGHLLILLATIFWAAENTLSKYVLRELSGSVVGFGRMFFGSLFIFLFLLFSGKAPLIVGMSFSQYVWILVTAGFLLIYVFSYYTGLKEIKVSTAACILTLGSPLTTLLAWVFKGGVVSWFDAVGMLLIVLGVVSVVWFGQIVDVVQRYFSVKQYEGS